MDIYSIFSLVGGLAFFLFGMNIMSSNLKKVAGGRLQSTLNRLTSNPIKSLALGAAITIAIQSSSALTVMLVGLVNSGIMELSQTVGVIMGSDIGTTLTSWILSLNGISSDNVFVSLLKPQNFAPIVALIGVILIMASKEQRRRDIGTILCGFSVLMFGMTLMSQTVAPLADMPQFRQLLLAFDNPIAGILIGTAFTGIIQSSAASIGVLQALALTGAINFGMAIPLIIGANIGTCVTAMLSAIGVSKKAKRVPLIHVGIKIIGAVAWMIVYLILRYVADLALFETRINSFEIAIFHTIFNLGTILLLFPASKLLVRAAERMIPLDGEAEEAARPAVLIDKRLLSTPAVAIGQCRSFTVEMARAARDAFVQSMDLISHYNKENSEAIIQMEDRLDYLEDQLNTFLLQISARNISDDDNNAISLMLHCITDFERISDHAANMTDIAKHIKKGKLAFSDAASSELETLDRAINEILDMMVVCFEQDDENLSQRIEPLEEVIDDLIAEIKNRHIDRLQTGECSGEMGVVLTDLLTNCERVSDHAANVAVSIIQTKNASFDTHTYIEELKAGQEPAFVSEYERYSGKYELADYEFRKKKDKKAKDKKEKKEKDKKGKEKKDKKSKEEKREEKREEKTEARTE